MFLEKAISENRNLQYLAVVIKENAYWGKPVLLKICSFLVLRIKATSSQFPLDCPLPRAHGAEL